MNTPLDFTLAKPQHLRTAHIDPITNSTRVVAVYTGQIYIGHKAASTRTGGTFEYPVLGLFSTSAGAFPGIIPLNDPAVSSEEFEGAVATASMSDMVYLDDDERAVWQIRDVAANLRTIRLNPGPIISAVVLSGFVDAERSEIDALQYHVTVISKQATADPRRFTPPILVRSAIWDGTYGLPLGGVIKTGVPQP